MMRRGESWKSIVISTHARRRMAERGATEAEVLDTIREDTAEPARRGLVILRRNHSHDISWGGKHCAVKQVACVVAVQGDRLVIVTVYTFYFQEGHARCG